MVLCVGLNITETSFSVSTEGSLPDALSELLGDKFQDFRTLAIDVHRCFAHPCSLRVRFRLDCLGYRFVEQDSHRFLSRQDALFDQRPIERDGGADGRHVVSRVMECIHRRLT
jgi:hypothetical protein